MYQLVMHHTYIGGSTFDVSGKGNHGYPERVAPGTGDASGSYVFDEPGSGILVPVSPTLQTLGALRIRMKIRVPAWDGARRNLVEGYLSFAFFLSGDGRLTGSIVDAAGNWTSVADDRTVQPDTWHEVEMVHDGVGTLGLNTDGRVVAVRDDVPGPVRPVGSLGVAIGRWPDSSQYVFKGNIGELQLWRYDPVATVTQFLDCCCRADLEPLDEILADLRGNDIDWRQVLEAARAGQQANLDLLAAVRTADPQQAVALAAILAAVRTALDRRDRARLDALRARGAAVIDASAGRPERDHWTQRITELATGLGWGPRELGRLARALCLDTFGPRRDSDSRSVPGGSADPWDQVATPEPFRRLDDTGSE
ncbi:LamG-like jellyroll fold domain-containing protein [Actinomadura kijaniata]|uniref:LamG-like jellyroll fold domain-containing protein n=1 Tax=Actinomadura kijaniata TaxID=46161 RepID=UPI000836ABC3|nr:LamG-like jellyroll fold domain-containing protein [Actinomadura kijaniata]